MSSNIKQSMPKQVLVAPTVTDPSMRNRRGPAEMLLNSETGVQLEDHDTVFGGVQKTKEEQDVSHAENSSQTSTMLIIVFALIVIALVALIVWMLMKQSNDKKDEDEMRKMIQPYAHPLPHPRNNMPPNYTQANSRNIGQTINPEQGYDGVQLAPEDLKAHQHNMTLMHQQQDALQERMAKMNSDLVKQDTKKSKKKQSKSFAEAMAEKDGKVMEPLKEPLLDEEQPTKKVKFSKKNPHPGILRPGGSEFQSDVDDVLQKTQSMLKKSGGTKVTKKEELTDLDKALLDKVNNNTDEQPESEVDEDT